MKNTCNYSDEWQPYINDYDKVEYDIKLNTGEIVENCYPNARKFHSFSSIHEGQSFHECEVAEIRFSEKPNLDIMNPDSDKPMIIIGKAGFGHSMSCSNLSKQQIEIYDDYLPFVEPIQSFDYTGRGENTFLKPRKITGTIVPVRTEPKIKRNEPCICGSGLKYKKCCSKEF